MKISENRGRATSLNITHNLSNFYASQRLETIGEAPNIIKLPNGKEITLFDPVPGYYKEWYPFLKEAIGLPYYSLNGDRQTYQREASGRWKQGQTDYFVRYRLHPNNCTSKRKYHQFANTGARIYNTPKLIEANITGKTVKRLFVVEGEKKALAGDIRGGIYCAGIGGKDLFRLKGRKELHPDLKKIIDNLKVKEVVLMIDNDFNKGDLKRRKSFYNTIRNFKNACELAGVSPFIQWIDENSGVKAIDDLFHKYPEFIEQFADSIKNLETSELIKTIKLNEYSRKQLRSFILYGNPIDEYFHVKGYLSKNKEVTKALCQSIQENDITIFNAGVGLGKTTLFMNGELNQMLSGYNIRFIAPLKTIVEQTEQQYKTPAIYGGKDFDNWESLETAPEIISTYASADKMPISKNDLLIIDEAHLLADWSFLDSQKILKLIAQAGKVILLSATNDELFRSLFPGKRIHRITVTTKQKPIKLETVFYKDNQTENLIKLIEENKDGDGSIIAKLDDKNRLAEIKQELIKRGIFQESEIAKFTANSEDEFSEEYKTLIDRQRLGNNIRLVLTTSKIQEGVNLLNENISLFITVEPRNARSFVQLIGRARKSENVRVIALFSEKFKDKNGYFQNNHFAFERLNKELKSSPIASLPEIEEEQTERPPKEFHSRINWKDSCFYNIGAKTFIDPFAVIKEVNDIESYFLNYSLWIKKVSSYADYVEFAGEITTDSIELSQEVKEVKQQIKAYKESQKDKALEMVTDYTQLVRVASAVYNCSKDTSYKSKLQRFFGFTDTQKKDGDTFRKMNPDFFELTKVEDHVRAIVELMDLGLDRYTALTVIEMNEGNLNKIKQETNRIVFSNLKSNGATTSKGLRTLESLKEMETILFAGAESVTYSKDELIQLLQKKCNKRFSKGTPNEIRNKLNGCAMINKVGQNYTLTPVEKSYLTEVKKNCVLFKNNSKKIEPQLSSNDSSLNSENSSLSIVPIATTLSA